MRIKEDASFDETSLDIALAPNERESRRCPFPDWPTAKDEKCSAHLRRERDVVRLTRLHSANLNWFIITNSQAYFPPFYEQLALKCFLIFKSI